MTKITASLIIFVTMLRQLGVLRTLYWMCWMVRSAILALISWPQPNVVRYGKFYVISFTIKNTKCKIICKESPYVIDIMENTESSVRDTLYPFFHVVPIDLYTYDIGKPLAVSILGQTEMQPAQIPYGVWDAITDRDDSPCCSVPPEQPEPRKRKQH